jgi:hypothetical protein
VGVVGATGLVWWILLFDRNVAPTVRRPSRPLPPARSAAG